jgi:hypothetical protein
MARHEIKTRNVGDGRFVAECKTHAVGTPALHYRPFDMWIKAHLSVKCSCGHVASSHGSIPVWTWHHANVTESDGTACGTCKCERYR